MDLYGTAQIALGKVLTTFSELWPILLLSVLVSAALKLYVDQDRVARFLRRNERNSVMMSTALAVGTPFCSCGTTAVVLGMIASTVPWVPIVAFLVASPLTSPQEMIYSAGLFGWPFAITFMAASLVLNLAGGGIAGIAEKRGWLKDQARFKARVKTALPMAEANNASVRPKVTAKKFGGTFLDLSWKLLFMFLGFSFLGYFLNGLIPQCWIEQAFGSGNAFSVPLASLLGLPFYINTEASLPLVRAFMDSGMSAGAALAFLITGAGTSIGAFMGALTIARWRVIAIVVGTLVTGAMIIGTAYDLFAAML